MDNEKIISLAGRFALASGTMAAGNLAAADVLNKNLSTAGKVMTGLAAVSACVVGINMAHKIGIELSEMLNKKEE